MYIDDKDKIDSIDDIYPDENYVCDSDTGGYYLTQSAKRDRYNLWVYSIYNYSDEKVARWKSRENALDMDDDQWAVSLTKELFDREAKSAASRLDHGLHDLSNTKNQLPSYYQPSLFDDTLYVPRSIAGSKSYGNYSQWSYPKYNNTYQYTPQPKAKGYLEKLNKSDTLVIHKTDPTTTMLSQIYEGKGWDVLNDVNVDTDEIHELIKNHDKILMLGHGYSGGLIGGNITSTEAPLLADKKLFVIWCNADAYFDRYLPSKHGFFCTGNMPSDSGEALAVGFKVSREYMDENITYWCKLCGDVAEKSLNGDPSGAVKYIRDNYWKKYGQGYNVDEVSDDAEIDQDIPDEVRITKYNWVRTKVQ